MRKPSKAQRAAVFRYEGMSPSDKQLMLRIVDRAVFDFPNLRGSVGLEFPDDGSVAWNFTTRRYNALVVYRPPQQTWLQFSGPGFPGEPPAAPWANLRLVLRTLYLLQHRELTPPEMSHIIRTGTPLPETPL